MSTTLEKILGPVTDPSLAHEISVFFLSQARELSIYHTKKEIECEYIWSLNPGVVAAQIEEAFNHTKKRRTPALYFISFDEYSCESERSINGALRIVKHRVPGASYAIIDPIMVSKKRRGIGTRLLQEAELYMQEHEAITGLTAHAHMKNEPSRKLFEANNYRTEPSSMPNMISFYKPLEYIPKDL